MATEAQIAANRANAKKSTGPRTERGKEVARLNALRHGLAARKLVIFDEHWEDLRRFHDELRQALAPADAMEEHLVERIVLCAWRLRRIPRVEAGLGRETYRVWRAHADEIDRRRAHAGIVFGSDLDTILSLSRYERAVERALHGAMEALARRQEQRRAAEAEARLQAEIDDEDERLLPPPAGPEPAPSTFDLPPIEVCNPADRFDHRNYRTDAEKAEIARRLDATRRAALGRTHDRWETGE